MDVERQMTKEEAVSLYYSDWWVGLDARSVVNVQLFTHRLIMPFSEFHKAIEDALGRPVFTHEFAFGGLKKEFLGLKAPPTFDEILDLIPEGKRVVIHR